MRTHYFCHYKGRVNAVRALGLSSPSAALKGIEDLEVAPDLKQLEGHWL